MFQENLSNSGAIARAACALRVQICGQFTNLRIVDQLVAHESAQI